jgi:adenosylhomocysteine nucleosidase
VKSLTGILITFAVREEAAPFLSILKSAATARVNLTGIGRRNAERAIREALAKHRPAAVITSGFAGALDPTLTVGTVVFDADPGTSFGPLLSKAGAVPVRFACTGRVVSSAREKQDLWKSSGANAVEMESEVIRSLCQQMAIPSATVRVISDAAHEDLPLDFNRFLGPDHQLNYAPLLWALVRSPRKLASLLRFRKQIKRVGVELSAVLIRILGEI